MPTQTTQPFIPNFANELDIESIISAPLVAASKANAVMVSGQTRFLLEYCFTKTGDSSYKPVMIAMSMSKGVPDDDKIPGDPDYIRQVEMSFSVPLICLIPINTLAVDKVSISFNMEVTAAISRPTGTANNTNNKVIDQKAQLNGKVGRDPDDTSSAGDQNNTNQSSSIKINVNAAPLPLPVGVLAILDLYSKAIQPTAITSNPPETNKV